ncbi:hypothetical protein BU15DRAFT_77724 [Melanogaster broomeanus]|nr:hypothetical protein BU15DRAFT_77724 [Melanogaster broomeanus]
MPDPGDALAAAEGSPPRARTAPDGSILQSTPSSRGLAASSEQLGIHTVNVSALEPWILQDVCNAEECKTDKFLAYLLQRVSESPGSFDETLLNKCLDAVLPFCNGEAGSDPAGLSPLIRNALTEYAKASNNALKHLKTLEIKGMRTSPSEGIDMFFQRNDPNGITQKHSGEKKTLRKPDLVILPFTEGSKHFKIGNKKIDRDTYIKDHTHEAGKSVYWKDLLSVAEFKWEKTPKMGPPPATYSRQNYAAPTPEFSKAKSDGSDADMDAEMEPPEIPHSSQANAAEQASAGLSTPATSGAGSKRPSEGDADVRSSKRIKTGDTPENKPPTRQPGGAVQTALYGAEMFTATLAVNHIINFTVRNDVIWMWYYDRQRVISVGGINFIQDLPRFLVLLYALQRFKLEDWGRNTEFTPQEKDDKIESYAFTAGGMDFVAHFADKERVTQFGMKGRGTDVMKVTSKQLEEKYPEKTKGGMVGKFYWGEEARDSEKSILQKVMKVTADDVQGHVPDLLFAHQFSVSTSTIRKTLGLEDPDRGSRTLWFLVFPKLFPITRLQGDELFSAWRQCVLCHYALWNAGIHHRDVSPANLMYYRRDDTNRTIVGVLNDYDLASLASQKSPLGNERTGTIPFMAIDLLDPDGQDGKLKHLYRHDMESFIWVFVWICFQYKGGSFQPRAPLHEWAKDNASGCVDKKRSFLAVPRYPEDLAIRTKRRVQDLVDFLSRQHSTRNGRKRSLERADTRLTEAQDRADPAPMIKMLKDEVEREELTLVEKPDHVFFEAFMQVIDFGKVADVE